MVDCEEMRREVGTERGSEGGSDGVTEDSLFMNFDLSR